MFINVVEENIEFEMLLNDMVKNIFFFGILGWFGLIWIFLYSYLYEFIKLNEISLVLNFFFFGVIVFFKMWMIV